MDLARASHYPSCQLNKARKIAKCYSFWRCYMDTQTTENLSGTDRAVRTVVGIVLVGSTLVFDLTPVEIGVMSLVAAYPLVTALIGWGPLTAIADGLIKSANDTPSHSPRL